MNIVVLNGSPKGETSVTMQYVRYLAQQYPQHAFNMRNVAQTVGRLERDEQRFAGVLDAVRSADAVLWPFPLYYMLVCSQYKRFIELLFERGAHEAFAGKYAASLSTSIHFYDQLAHGYIRAICEDLGMPYVGAFSANKDDLLQPEGQAKLTHFGRTFLDAAQRRTPTSRWYQPVVDTPLDYTPGTAPDPCPVGERSVVVLTDSDEERPNLGRMVERLRAAFAGPVEVINLHEVDIKGPCLGCCKCAFDNECAYTGKDGFRDFFEGHVKTADVLVFAASIKARQLSATWRRVLDRSFYNGHVACLTGKQLAYVLSGPLRQLPELRELLEVYGEVQQANVVDVVSDDCQTSAQLDGLLDGLAARLIADAEADYVRPPTFRSVAGRKLLRDEIFGGMRVIFQADDRAYRRSGAYDFPTNNLGARIRNASLAALLRIPALRRGVRKRMKQGMIEPFQKVLAAR